MTTIAAIMLGALFLLLLGAAWRATAAGLRGSTALLWWWLACVILTGLVVVTLAVVLTLAGLEMSAPNVLGGGGR